jgi:hypothetical protein
MATALLPNRRTQFRRHFPVLVTFTSGRFFHYQQLLSGNIILADWAIASYLSWLSLGSVFSTTESDPVAT